ncbi:fad-binding domain-containing [Trichoderma arundinaceum]|uniref:Fad-binding domain-containing n=1 Tax=Trichoderma arundinaceum TaxID=490622 RepID=A0A395NU40_TRIAR|nr:fad-binding domain-containing [Trichoderma arundinaceum]
MRASLCTLRSVTGQLFKSLDVPVLEPGQAEYDRAIATSNRLFRFSRPDCVVQPETAKHVQAIVREAASKNIDLTIKCNGHSYAGHSTAMKGVSLDLRRMRNVNLDMNSNIVTMDAGCQWGRVYETLINGRHNGYIINGGRCPTVGVSGFILGGGLGPFTRSFGMGCDTLAEATVVTATGDLVTVKETDDPNSKEGKLFWALQGAGGGNFGVVVEMKLKVQKLQNIEGTVVAGRYQWFPEEGLSEEVISTMDEFYTTNWPNNTTIDSTWVCDLRQNKTDGIRFNVSFDGSRLKYERVINKHIRNEKLKTHLKRRALPEKSTRFLYETLVNQWLEETERSYPTNQSYELYSSFVFKNDDKNTINKVTRAIRDLMKEFRKEFNEEKVNFLVTWIHSGGKATEKNPVDSAFFWREAVFHTYVTVEWMDKWMEKDMRFFLAKVKNALRPLSLNGEAAFVNFPDRDFPTKLHERAYFGDNREELRRVKEMWDKNKFFKFAQGIRLPGDPEEDPDEEMDKTDRLANQQWESDRAQWKPYRSTDFEKGLDYLEDLGF